MKYYKDEPLPTWWYRIRDNLERLRDIVEEFIHIFILHHKGLTWSDGLDARDYENAKAAYEAELEETNELRRQ